MNNEQVPVPLLNNNSNIKISDRMSSYLHEWAGLCSGFKQASIFYLKQDELEEYRKFFKQRGFCALSSEFAYNYGDAGVEKTTTNINPSSGFSLYVSTDEKTAGLLKDLDHHHQFQTPHPRKSSREIFFEISSLLGYPLCCSRFLQSVHENPKFRKEVAGLGTQYSDETLYPMLALGQSKGVDWRLNNFSEHTPRLISFFVCSYQCKHAIGLAQKVHDYWSAQRHNLLASLSPMSDPLLFFSPKKIIHFDAITRMDGIFSYEKANPKGYFNERELIDALSRGNRLSLGSETISVFRDDNPLYVHNKTNVFDGTLINLSA